MELQTRANSQAIEKELESSPDQKTELNDLNRTSPNLPSDGAESKKLKSRQKQGGNPKVMTAKELLEDLDIQDWQNSTALKSKGTAKTYLYILNSMKKDLNPLNISEKDNLTVKRWLLKKFQSLTPKSQNLYLSAVKSWLGHKKIKADLDIKLSNQSSTPTLTDEKIPEKHQIREVLLSLGVRGRVIASLIAFAGLRFESIFGITLGDIIDLDIEKLEMRRTPALIHIPPEANKTPVRYFTFLIEEGCEYLIAYLKERRARGEELTGKSPVIATNNKKSKALCKDKMARILASSTHRFLKARPYVLRSYFDSCLLMAKVHPQWQSFFMGHRGNIEAVYTTRKNLPESLIENMRESFKPAIEYLSTSL